MNTVILSIQIITTLLMFGTFVVYYFQLIAMTQQLTTMQRTSQAESLLTIINSLSEENLRMARKKLIVAGNKPFKKWINEDLTAARKVCASYNLVEIMIKEGVIPAGVIETHWSESIKACRTAADSYIKDQRSMGNNNALTEFDNLYFRVTGKMIE